eukprot:c955_g1_i1.p1 GENE.c955_g1_i1~~c955_g1_i1.p1  ORF type:complete len:179 (-),score=26.77 c955_g1_i1:297-833(-)
MESDQEKIRRLLEGSVSELQNRIEVLKHHRSRVQRLNYETEKLRVAKITLEGDFTQLKDQIEKLCVTQNSLHETIVDQTILAEERVKVVLAQPVNSQSTSTVEQARKCLDEMNKLTTAINRSLVLVEPVVTGAVESEVISLFVLTILCVFVIVCNYACVWCEQNQTPKGSSSFPCITE